MKASPYHAVRQTCLPEWVQNRQHRNWLAIADDSGIVVDALDGAPGIYSSRYSGDEGNDEANNEKLLREMQDETNRAGRFVCAIVFIDENGKELVSQACVEGKIDDHLHGEGGFGYDPLFLPDEYGGELSMAELTMDQKNAISHRGKALREMREQLLGAVGACGQ